MLLRYRLQRYTMKFPSPRSSYLYLITLVLCTAGYFYSNNFTKDNLISPMLTLFTAQPREATGEHNPKQYVVYIKVEKTASSSFSRIFKSYGLTHRLRMILPLTTNRLINTREMMPGLSWDIAPSRGPPNLSMNHHRYNRPFFDKHFPRNDTVYIASIRHPVKWFISYVDYMKAYRKIGKTPRSVLLEDRLFYKSKSWVCQMDRHVHNNFLQWLGFRMDSTYRYNEKEIKKYIKFIDKKFGLIMITEYFYESVLLLRRTLNWSMKDIFFGFINEADYKSGTVLNKIETAKLLNPSHNRGDWLLYQYFNLTLWEKIAKEPDFYEELAVFKDLNAKVVEFCNSIELMRDPALLLHLSTRWEPHIEINERRCIAIRTHPPGTVLSEERDGSGRDELYQELRAYANFPHFTPISDLRLNQYEGVPWPQ